LSIGLGQLVHAIRRNVNMLYLIENNGVYGLTKGQFSASADVGSKSKRGEPNQMAPIDPVTLALTMGATFVARSFSGDKEQLVPILKAALSHRGLALIDVISPCVTFNDHSGSTKSYLYTRRHQVEATAADFIPPANEIVSSISPRGVTDVTMHDGSVVRFRSVPDGYDPLDRTKAISYLEDRRAKGEIVTGLLFVDESAPNLHDVNDTSETPLVNLPFEKLCPGAAALEKLQEELR
jgi:2-oxoglutarate ferredoxin oxidoreductase subunit beta